MSTIQENCRLDILEQLQLTASKAEQLDYHRKVPIAYVSDELFWGWESAYQYHLSQKWFEIEFSVEEREIFASFDIVFKRIRASQSDGVPQIIEFQKTSEWFELSSAARKALDKLTTVNL